MKIARMFKFESAHQLPYHDGKCQRLHGHSYRLELVFTGTPRKPDASDPQSGFVADFGLIDELVKGELINPQLDHYHLNETIPELPYTSAEYLAAWIVGWCMKNMDGRAELGDCRIETARLWETVNAWAEADRNDAEQLGFA
uniref:6-carboxy-5,6,7,8-tetrahydropterin synthase n=1 Tax=Magnetococcus massalia (strain MO-1) TaxID=451514 RepID=A0A1S7LMQ3_MAGMO|nr:putative 6-pyruvoyl-tetrahydropterin synthase [Candidatus Magnetococcus massalia]